MKNFYVVERSEFIGEKKLAGWHKSINFLSEYMPDKYTNHVVTIDDSDVMILHKTQLLYQLGELNKLRSQLIQELTTI